MPTTVIRRSIAGAPLLWGAVTRIDESLRGVVQMMFAAECNHPGLVLPPALPSGGRIGVAAPSSPVSTERLEQGVAALRAMGFQVVLASHALERSGHHAGTPRE